MEVFALLIPVGFVKSNHLEIPCFSFEYASVLNRNILCRADGACTAAESDPQCRPNRFPNHPRLQASHTASEPANTIQQVEVHAETANAPPVHHGKNI